MDENMNGVEEVKEEPVVVYDMPAEEEKETSKAGAFIGGALLGAALGLIPMGIKAFKNRKNKANDKKKKKLAEEVKRLGGVVVFNDEIEESSEEVEDKDEE